MDFFNVKRFRRARKPKCEEEQDPDRDHLRSSEESKDETVTDSGEKASAAAAAAAAEEEDYDDDDDDDFITNEVKRRLKELRKNSFMVLIPEETCPEEGEGEGEGEGEVEEEETSSSEWRESQAEAGYNWCGFDTLYNKYCERMLFFDKMSAQQLKETGCWDISNQSPRSTAKRLASTLRNLSFKRRDGLQEDREQLQQTQDEDPYHNLETAYVAQICLAWEVLHCQYMQLSQRISSQHENPTSYSYAAQAFQQFQVLLQRFIENEPFEQGSRVENFARARFSLPMLLQVPNFQGLAQKENAGDNLDYPPVLASDLLNIMEESILTFRTFLKMDKKKSIRSLNLFKGQNQDASSLHQVQTSLDKKETKVKELSKKKSWKKKSWPSSESEAELLLGLIDIKVVSRVLRMARISKEQLLWCEEKMSKIDLSQNNKLRRDGSPILFPC